jgi:TPR repeat protein
VSGAPKSGKSRSVLEVLRREHPDAVTWWVNPSPSVLPLVVQAAKKAQGEERPAFIVLDDAGLIGTDPAAGLTARRLQDLAAACGRLVIVVHDETFASWEHQLTHRTAGEVDTRSIGATRELMDLLQHRIHYSSVLNDEETAPAAEAYEHADPRVKGFDLTRLAETLAGVQTLLANARKTLQTPASIEAALLEAAIDASIAFPAGTTTDILTSLATTHYRRRQPNRLWRPHLLEDAFDTLTTGITTGSPHAILTTTDHHTYRLLDALTPELQHAGRNPLSTIKDSALPENVLDHAILTTGLWHHQKNEIAMAIEAWKQASERGDERTMILLAATAEDAGDTSTARIWWESAAEYGDSRAMSSLGVLAYKAGEVEAAMVWWEKAANHGDIGSMMFPIAAREGELDRMLESAAGNSSRTESFMHLGILAEEAGEQEAALTWYEHAARNGHPVAMNRLGEILQENGNRETARNWFEQAASTGATWAMGNLASLDKEEGDLDAARTWWERAADEGSPAAMGSLGSLAADAGDLVAARTWWKRAADAGSPEAMDSLSELAQGSGDVESTRMWRERAAETRAAQAERFRLFQRGASRQAAEAQQPDQ